MFLWCLSTSSAVVQPPKMQYVAGAGAQSPPLHSGRFSPFCLHHNNFTENSSKNGLKLMEEF